MKTTKWTIKWTRSSKISQIMPYTSVFVLNVKKSKDSRAIQRTGNIPWFVGEIGKFYFPYDTSKQRSFIISVCGYFDQ